MAKRKKNYNRLSIKNNPHLLGETPLELDGFTKDELLEKTNAEKATVFLDKYKRVVHPITAYPDFFRRNENLQLTFSFIKRYYIKFVINGDWSEKKFVVVLNNILANNAMLTKQTIIENGYDFDNGNLVNRTRGRRRRL